jgi:hypothetical protein
MASRSKRGRKKTGRRSSAWRGIRERASSPSTRQALVAIAWLTAVAAAITGWVLGVPRLHRYATEHGQQNATEIVFLDAPVWMNGDLETHLVLTATAQMRGDPLERDDLVAVRAALLETGWFNDIRQVRRAAAGRVEIDAWFMQPYAVLRDAAGDHLVDPHGRLLPRSVAVGQATVLTVIEGAREQRPARPGDPWPGADVSAALRVKRIIDQRPWTAQVKSIDVSRHRVDQELYLVTDRGHRIRWGRPPGEEGPGEVNVQRKLHYLDYPYTHFGHIDGGHGGELDITDPRGVFAR